MKSKEERKGALNASARAAYHKRVSTPEGRAAHREKRRRWNEKHRGGAPRNKPPGYWTLEQCATEAQKFITRISFQKGCSSGYYTAVRNGWLDEICRHMMTPGSPRVKWDYEACRREAAKYTTRSAFSDRSSGAYQTSTKNGWLDDVCAHMKPKWTRALVQSVAAECSTRAEFKARNNAAYIVACRRGWMDEICAHMSAPNNMRMFTRQAYLIRARESRDVYVGISVDPARRYVRHGLDGVAAVRSILCRPHRFLVLTAPIPLREAADMERALVLKMRGLGWNVVNKAAPGGLGSTPIKWSRRALQDEASKYATIAEFRAGNPSAYATALKHGLFEAVAGHLTRQKQPNGHWTKDRILAALAKTTSRKEAEATVPYMLAANMGFLAEALAHLPLRAPRTKKAV